MSSHTASSTSLPVEKQTTQIENLVDHTRGKDRVETEVMKLQDDIVILKETTSIQPVIAKRHQSGQSVPHPMSAPLISTTIDTLVIDLLGLKVHFVCSLEM